MSNFSQDDEEEAPEMNVEKSKSEKLKVKKTEQIAKPVDNTPIVKRLESPQKSNPIDLNKNQLNNNNKKNATNLVEFHDFEEANPHPVPQPSNSSLIDLNSNQNLKDMKYKEKTDSIFKLYENSNDTNVNNSAPKINQNVQFNNNNHMNYSPYNQINNPYYNQNPNPMFQAPMGNQYYNQFPNNNGNYNMYNTYQQQPNMFQGQIYNNNQMGMNTQFTANNSNGLYNGSGSMTYNNQGYQNFNVNTTMTSSNNNNNNMKNVFNLNSQNKNDKNLDPFKGLVNFK